MNPKVVRRYAAKMAAELRRRVTPEEAEREMARIAIQVAGGLAPRYAFGYYTAADVEQEGVVFALEVLATEKYDAARPLENFLHVHIRNRLHNLKRHVFMRSEPPCTCCDPFDPPAEPCKKWRDWSRRNTSKQNIMRPLDMDNVSDDGEAGMSSASDVEDRATLNELIAKIDRSLPVELRADYMRMRENVAIPKARRQRVRRAVLDIISPAEGEGDGD